MKMTRQDMFNKDLLQRLPETEKYIESCSQ